MSERPGVDGSVFLGADAVQALAHELAPLVAERLSELLAVVAVPTASRPLTAREVAGRLGLSYDFVREHRHELGVLAASGSRPRLLFDAREVDAWATSRSGAVRSPATDPPVATGKSARRRPPSSGTGGPLLPIHGVEEAAGVG